jgi:hypothetical protein
MSTVERVIEEIKKSGVAASEIVAALRALETKVKIGTIGNQQQALSGRVSAMTKNVASAGSCGRC